MTPALLFSDGWAMPARFWTTLQELLPPAMRSGPFAGRPVVAVGHSLGVVRLLLDPPPRLAGLVAINGFTRLAEAPGHPGGVGMRVLQRMARRLRQEPGPVVAEFRMRCGLAPPDAAGESLDLPALSDGFCLLQEADARAALDGLRCPVLALAGGDDAIVPPDLSAACFSKLPDLPDGRPALRWVDRGSHVLPVTHPQACAAAILDLVRALG